MVEEIARAREEERLQNLADIEEQQQALAEEREEMEHRAMIAQEEQEVRMRQEAEEKNKIISDLEYEKSKIEADLSLLRDSKEKRRASRPDLRALTGIAMPQGDGKKQEWLRVSVLVKEANELSQQLQGALRDDQRQLLERSLQSMESAQRWMRELSGALRGGKIQQGRFDVANAVLRVAERMQQDGDRRIDLQVLMPPNLPRVTGTTVVFERLLSQLLRQRLDEGKPNSPLTLLARCMGVDGSKGVLVSVVDTPDPNRRIGTGHPPESVRHGIVQMGGEAVCVEDSRMGRVTSMKLQVAAA